MTVPTQSATKHTNRLIQESSPYLLQHAHNPVDWYPWGPEAFEAARTQDKPIFLSIGYSTCYWCHVMERECFENEQIAEEMNRRFINIKVDREERPDVDQLYMAAVQVLTHQGGWPLNVFLTSDLRPFYGGTYFPPVDALGRPGFLTLLRAIDGAYHERLGDVQATCSQLVAILHDLAEPPAPETPVTINPEFIEELIQRSTADYDPTHGGFGGAPKFPRQTLLAMLLVHNRYWPNEQRLRMVLHTLDAMAQGGIHDHLGGGFHRYSTDAKWLVPHFEIMLYDNAMLAWIYAEAYQQTHTERYAAVARGILDFVLREMTSPDGAFYTALDAEVDAQEGLSYLWTPEQVTATLGPEDAALFNRVYGLDRGPNFVYPHHGTGSFDKNILYLPQPIAQVAQSMGLCEDDLLARLRPLRQRLYDARRLRKQPALDTKIITSWNALMIRALAYGGYVLREPRYTDAATHAADYLMKQHVSRQGRVLRASREGVAKHEGFLDDYACLAWALLELRDWATQAARHEEAASLAQRMVEHFGDKDEGGFYFTSKHAKDLLVRQKIGTDSPLPSGNAVAAMVMLSVDQGDLARDTIAVFARQLDENPDAMSAMLQAAMLYVRENEEIAISPGPWRGQPVPSSPSPQQLATQAVSVQASWLSAQELQLQLSIASDFHINAHDPGTGLVPTQLLVSGDAANRVEFIDYPSGQEQRFAFSDSPVRVYTTSATFVVRFRQPMTGAGTLRMALVYQPCNDQACLPTTTKEIEVATP
ncbi:MAG TPA: DUF255 domain-containing protein [Tepidisphaeraceae bacterium]|nr:DUF255 domain-containing protein [Tepidisphaeraceae bacterium]